MSQKKYDFIIPIGWGCLNTHNLRLNKLQRESLPFDWIWFEGIPVVTHYIKTKFSEFMKKENLLFLRHNGDADIYRDIHDKSEFWHDFMIGETFEKAYDRNYQKYQRRISRLFYHINRAHSVLWVRYVRIFPNQEKTEEQFMFEKEQLSDEQVIEEFRELQNLYPEKKFNLLLIYTYNEPHHKQEYDLTPDIHVCEFYNDERLGWKGNEQVIAEILQNYDLTYSAKIYYALNTLFFKIKKCVLGLFSKQRFKSQND
ncbi:MAG: hypothetical protein IJ660_06955 [Alphaproteobacteria bacterium]|nr:hypothetical protein [Alphaproteobacteria bacterium]